MPGGDGRPATLDYGESGGRPWVTSGWQEAGPPCAPRHWREPSLGDLLGPGAARQGEGATETREPSIPRESESCGWRDSDGGPGGAFARGRGHLPGPLTCRWSGTAFLLVPEGRAATPTAPTVLVVAPCGEGSGGCGDGSAAGGGGQARGLVTIGGDVTIDGLVLSGVGVTIRVGVGVLGGGHLGRKALDHLWLTSTWVASAVLLAVVKSQLPPHW